MRITYMRWNTHDKSLKSLGSRTFHHYTYTDDWITCSCSLFSKQKHFYTENRHILQVSVKVGDYITHSHVSVANTHTHTHTCNTVHHTHSQSYCLHRQINPADPNLELDLPPSERVPVRGQAHFTAHRAHLFSLHIPYLRVSVCLR